MLRGHGPDGMTSTDATGDDRRARAVVVGLGVVALALGIWVRISNHTEVLTAEAVLPLTSDATYHMRRSMLAYAEFPSVPVFDRLMNWPEGAYCHWADGYDWLGALLARCLAGGDAYAAAAVIAGLPILFGLGCAALAAYTAHRLVAPRTAGGVPVLLTWCLALLLPLGVFNSLLGRTDHHCAEALIALALSAWLLGRYPSTSFAAGTAWRRWRFEASGALLIAGSMYTFTGALMYVAPVAAALIWTTLCAAPPPGPRGLAGSGAPALAAGGLATAALYAHNLRVHGDWFSYAFPSVLQPLLLGAAALSCAAACACARIVQRGASRVPLRRLAALLGALAVLIGLASLVRVVREPVVAAISEHLLRQDPWIGTIEEFKPLLAWSSIASLDGWQDVLKDFGAFGPASVLLLPLGIGYARTTQAERAWAFAWCAGWLLALSLLQNRFARVLVPVLAIWTALGLCSVGDELRARVRGVRMQAIVSGSIVVLALSLLLGAEPVRARLGERRVEPGAPQQASLFLRQHNPVRADGTRAGVLTSWAAGHNMVWPGESGVVANGFLFHVGRRGLEQVQAALGGAEADALQLMRERDLTWLAIGAAYYYGARAGHERIAAIVRRSPGGAGVVNVDFLAHVPLAVSMLGGGGVPQASVPHLAQLTPRWASPQTLPAMAFYLPELWLFERVQGALLSGHAAPGARIVGEIELGTRGHRLPYRAFTDADASGAFVLRVALWNGVLGDQLQTGADWTLSAEQGPAVRAVIGEADVRSGRRIDVGRLGAAELAVQH
jgi:hypothetical protein